MRIGKMKLLAIALLASVVALIGQTASADLVTYSTSGVFSGGSGTLSLGGTAVSLNGATLTFAGFGDSVDAPTFARLGQFAATNPPLTNPPTIADFAGTNFTLTITQFVPLPNGPGSQALSAMLNGQLKFNGSSLVVDFGTQTAVFNTLNGGVITTTTYYPSTPSQLFQPAATSINPNTVTTLQGSINIETKGNPLVPLPASAGADSPCSG